MICGLGVLSESLCKPLGNRSSRADVFRLGKESGCPDSVAFFKQFIWKVGFWVGRLFGCQLGFVFPIGIFYKGWEGASPAGIYPFSVLPLCVLFCPVWEAPGHFDSSCAEVNLRIVLVQPGEPEYHALLAEVGNHEQNTFGMSAIGHDHVDDFADAPGLIKGSVHIVNQDRLGQLAGWKFCSDDEVLVNEISGSTGINYGFHGCFLHSVRCL